jgi:hypothetical protein
LIGRGRIRHHHYLCLDTINQGNVVGWPHLALDCCIVTTDSRQKPLARIGTGRSAWYIETFNGPCHLCRWGKAR